MRLAWFSPVPPIRTGIAGKSAELIAALRQRGISIDVYVDGTSLSANGGAGGHDTAPAHDFVWRHAQQPYDLTIFQFGNSSHHDYIWPYALRYPGLVVLHDTRLHHARAAQLLRERRAADYRAEFAWNHPGADPDLAEIAIAGLDSALFYDWPMVRALVASARLTAVHGEGTRAALLDDLARQGGSASGLADRIVAIRLGEGETLNEEDAAAARARVRARHGIAADAIVFGVFGGLTPEKRIPQVLAAFAAARPQLSEARLLLAGAPAAHYDVQAAIAAHDLGAHAIVTGYLPSDAELIAHVAACDVSLNLRWPTARETSGPWLRALAAGRATIVTDLVHTADVPSLDPRTWRVNRVEARGARREARDDHDNLRDLAAPRTRDLAPLDAAGEAVCVAIDILDEGHSLRVAMRRLAADAALREQLGRAARTWWQRKHSFDAMVEDYVDRIERARTRSVPAIALPPHARGHGDAALRALIEPFGVAAALSRDGLLR